MKKNKMMRIASVLLVAVLLSTCVISGTFAKYVTSASGSDSARVAKFGVVVAVNVDGAFASEYAATADVATGTAIAKTVISSTKDENENLTNVLAPGTAGWLLESVTISGEPEVAVNVSAEATLTLTGWEVEGEYYCPLIITVDSTALHGTNYESAEEFAAAVEELLDLEANFAPNAPLSYNHTVAWRWEFEGAASSKQTDENDTKLGNAGNATIAFNLTITVTQIGGSLDAGETASSEEAPVEP